MAQKCPTMGTFVPSQSNDSLILIPDRGNSFPMFAKLERNEKETNLLKIRLASLIFFTSRFLFSRCRRYT